MAKYSGTFSCGHEGYVNVIGPARDRQWKIDKAFSGLCEECYKKQREARIVRENTLALEKAKEMELPELVGTEKQVAWANTLRNQLIERINETIDKIKNEESMYRNTIKKAFGIKKSEAGGTKEGVTKAIVEHLYEFQDCVMNKTKATYFINNRDTGIAKLILDEMDYRESVKENEIKNQIIKETTVEPSEVMFDGVVEIVATENNIKVLYQRNDTFIKIVKELNYKWRDNCWQRSINSITGSYIDRSAEVANKLLNAGFRVAIPEVEIKEKALTATYEVECDRWIFNRVDTNKFAIKWYEKNDDLYSASKCLKGARWDSGSMLVNVQNYKQVEEFAEMYGFKFTEKALELIEQYKKELEKIERVDVKEAKEVPVKNGLEDILNSSREVLEDLVEED